MASIIVDVGTSACALGLSAGGAVILGITSTWRGTWLALACAYVGVVVVLARDVGGAVALSSGIVGIGVLALTTSRMTLPTRRTTPRREQEGPPISSWRPLRRRGHRGAVAVILGTSPGRAPRPFDLSVVALAVVGAGGLALTHPLFGVLAADGTIDVLVLAGALGCLLGPPARAAGGLLFIVLAGHVALLHADPMAPAGEMILFAAAQVALALGLVSLAGEVAPPAPPDSAVAGGARASTSDSPRPGSPDAARFQQPV